MERSRDLFSPKQLEIEWKKRTREVLGGTLIAGSVWMIGGTVAYTYNEEMKPSTALGGVIASGLLAAGSAYCFNDGVRNYVKEYFGLEQPQNSTNPESNEQDTSRESTVNTQQQSGQ